MPDIRRPISSDPRAGHRRPLIRWLLLAALLLTSVFVAQRNAARRSGGDLPVLEVARSVLTKKEGRLFHAGQPFAGFMTEHYPDGALRSRSAISNGLLHGVSEGWFTNNVLQIREYFVNGVSHGERLRWNEEGQKMSEARVVDGKIEGIFRRWHDNGQMAELVTMKNGQPEGLSRAWYPSGSLKAEATVSHGQIVERRSYADGEGSEAITSPANSLAGPVRR